ncbi:MAG: TlpA family protein disulfide reductase [Leucobacter sp.]|jgi:thiol-disulfide isomerase/thioredoxin|nr:TlpA family protein disulfide reductase [Leucobacter sp.]
MRAFSTAHGRGRSRFARVAAPLTALPLAAALVLVGCSSDAGLQAQWEESGDKGYIAGDGATTSFAQSDRTDPVQFEGVTEHGGFFSSDDTIGHVTVVNFWYAGCAPCRAEAGDLVEVYEEFESEGVQFVGVNTRDQAAQAVQFAKQFGVAYPSILDSEGGRAAQQAFAGQVPLNAVPTTLVLDAEGRVAHRVVGQLAAASQLRTLVAETVAETQN